MIVNDTFVRRLFPGQHIVGVPLALAWVIAGGYYPYGVRTIVGVVADSVYQEIRQPVRPMIYVPLAQREPIPQKDLYLGVRSAGGSPALLQRNLAAAITAFNQDLGFEFQPLGRQVDESLANERVMAVLSAGVGGLAMLLAGSRPAWGDRTRRVATTARDRHPPRAWRSDRWSDSTRGVARERTRRVRDCSSGEPSVCGRRSCWHPYCMALNHATWPRWPARCSYWLPWARWRRGFQSGTRRRSIQ